MKKSFAILWLAIALLEQQVINAQDSLTVAINRLMAKQLPATEPGGVVLAACNGKIIYQQAFGMADMEQGIQMTAGKIFYIGSNTKQFTAIAILQLMAQSKLSLQDTLGKFFVCPNPVSSIRITQLLSHTSGIADNAANSISGVPENLNNNPVQKDVYKLLRTPVKFTAGTKWEYNNVNYQVLGLIIEQLTGMSYSDYLDKYIFGPALMQHSHAGKDSIPVKDLALGYTNFKAGIKKTTATPSLWFAAGGIQSTAEDMMKWNTTLINGKLLNPLTLQLAFTPQLLANGQPTKYGYGWRLDSLHGSPIMHHGGLVPGYTSETSYFPKEDVYLVILLNEETPKVPLTALSRIIGGMIIGKPYGFNDIGISEKILQQYAGVYKDDFGEMVNISIADGKAVFQRPNGNPHVLGYAGNEEFFFNEDFLRVCFSRNSLGAVNSLQTSKVDIQPTTWQKINRQLLPLAPGSVNGSLLQQYTGVYLTTRGDSIKISRDGPSLYLEINDGEKKLLAAKSDLQFFLLNENTNIEFVKDAGFLHITSGGLTKSATKQ